MSRLRTLVGELFISVGERFISAVEVLICAGELVHFVSGELSR